MFYTRVLTKLPILLARAAAGDPTAIALLTAAGVAFAVKSIKDNA